jgi:hypothetical protein
MTKSYGDGNQDINQIRPGSIVLLEASKPAGLSHANLVLVVGNIQQVLGDLQSYELGSL